MTDCKDDLRVLSFDVGSKHLAMCNLTIRQDQRYTIQEWAVTSCIPEGMNVNKTPVQDIAPLFARMVLQHKDRWLSSGIDHIFIETQPMGAGRGSIRNLKTKILSHILQILLDPVPCSFVHPSLKLKNMIRENGKSTYRENKKYAIQETERLLAPSDDQKECLNALESLELFCKSKTKKDDLADAFLQGLYAGRMLSSGDFLEPVKKEKKEIISKKGAKKAATRKPKVKSEKASSDVLVFSTSAVDACTEPVTNILDTEASLVKPKKRKTVSNK